MHDSYTGLYVGIAFSMLLVYLLMVVNFQSGTQPFIIITPLPCTTEVEVRTIWRRIF
ncbi:MAG TPA: hypothetical protein VE860_19420 [Chthoniobacterales bacterium]|jgi:multidrug efflux pump subunit AcrB|nr:hypothetical protein [Chthoniobacterales bacterium]